MQLHELKKQFEKCRHELMLLHHLLEKREMEMKMMHELKLSIENELIRVKKCVKTDSNKTKNIKEQMDTHAEQMVLLKKSVKRIDSEIDALGEEKELECAALKQRLIDEILTQHSEAANTLSHIEQQRREADRRIEWLNMDSKLLDPLFTLIHEGAAMNTHISLLGFLLGKTPRTQLSKIAAQTAELSEKTLPECQTESIKLFLQECIQKTQNPWTKNFNLETFKSLQHASVQLMQSIEKAKQKELITLSDQEQAFEAWLTRYCQ